MTRRQYSNTATVATLTGGIASADASFTLTSFAGYPAVPFTATISRGETDEEVVLITAVSASTVTATRGYDNTTAKSHAAGASFIHTTVAKDFDEANVHVNASSAVHGAVGTVVGTTDVQTLTNKTLTSPVLSNAVNTGTAQLVNAAISGTLSVIGATTLTSVSATNGTFSGTLSVTGVVTIPAETAATSPVRKSTTDALATRITATETTLTAATNAATVSTLAKRDAAGRLQVVDPAVAADVATKNYADGLNTAMNTRMTTVETKRIQHTTSNVKVFHGTANAVFSSVSFANATLDLTAAGFTATPLVVATPQSGNSQAIYGGIDFLSSTSATFVARAGVNITATVPISFVAIGV